MTIDKTIQDAQGMIDLLLDLADNPGLLRSLIKCATDPEHLKAAGRYVSKRTSHLEGMDYTDPKYMKAVIDATAEFYNKRHEMYAEPMPGFEDVVADIKANRR